MYQPAKQGKETFGLIIGTRAYFNSALAIDVRKTLCEKLEQEGYGYVILDVREQDEFDESHIPGAILIPHGQIKELAPSMLPDKDQLILVYCRSGRRSKIAAEALEEMGYTNIKEFGGINDWPYETVGE